MKPARTPTATASAKRTACRCRVLYQTSTNAVRQDFQALIKQWWSRSASNRAAQHRRVGVLRRRPGSPDTFQKFYADVEMYANTFNGTDPQAYLGNMLCDKAPRPETQWQGENISRFCMPEYDALSCRAVIFMIVKLSPSDPTANLPLTIPPEVREQIRESLGVNEPLVGQYLRWARMMFITEPLIMLEDALCSEPRLAHRVMPEGCWQIVPPDTSRIISYQTRSPVFDLIAVSLPQTLWVVGSSYIIGILIGMPIGHHLGLQAVFRGSTRVGDLLLDGRLLGPDLLHRRGSSSSSRSPQPTRGGGSRRSTTPRTGSTTGTASSSSSSR
jgi:hypothetical protein